MAEQLRLNIIDNEIKAYLDQLTESHEDQEEELNKTDGLQLSLFMYFEPARLELLRKRPEGHLGKLYDIVTEYTIDPQSEIAAMAEDANKRWLMRFPMYQLLKHRLPFHGAELKSMEEMGEILGRGKDAVRYQEKRAAEFLYDNYLSGLKFQSRKNYFLFSPKALKH